MGTGAEPVLPGGLGAEVEREPHPLDQASRGLCGSARRGYNVAFIAKGVDLMLIALLIVASYRNDGSPMQIAWRLIELGARFVPRHGRA